MPAFLLMQLLPGLCSIMTTTANGCAVVIVEDIIVVVMVLYVSFNAPCMVDYPDIIFIAAVDFGAVLNLGITAVYTSAGTDFVHNVIVDNDFNIVLGVSDGVNSVSAMEMNIDTNADVDCIGVVFAVSDEGDTVIVVFFAVMFCSNRNNSIVLMTAAVGVDLSMMNCGVVVVDVF